MQRVLHLLSSLEVGGKERVALDLAARARRAGLDHRMCLFDAPFRDRERDFEPGAVPVAFIPRRPGVDWRFVLELARHVRAQGFDVIQAYNDTALFYAGAAGLRLGRRRPRIVASFHTRPGHDTLGARLLTRWAARRLDGVTAVSEDLSRYLVRRGWVGRCETLENGVDLAAFAPEGPVDGTRAALGLASGALLVAHVARFDPLKRHADLLAAARTLAGESPPLTFALAGEGPLRRELEAQAADLPRVHFIPRVHDVAAFLRSADLFVLCSEQEAAPRVLLEALACGRASVATDVGGVRALLTGEDGEAAGVIVPPGRPDSLAQALLALARSPARRRDLEQRALRRAEVFSAEREWRRYRALWSGCPKP